MHASDVAEEKKTYAYTKREQKCGRINIDEALISKGLAHCLRHQQNDDQRSSCFDDLLAAVARAVKNAKGVHNKKDHPFHRVADISSESTKAKQFLPFLQRAGKTVALVEFVASGSQVKLYLPKDTCHIIAGISCARPPRQTEDSLSGKPYGKQALYFTKELIMHREVEAFDKGGNFLGWLSGYSGLGQRIPSCVCHPTHR